MRGGEKEEKGEKRKVGKGKGRRDKGTKTNKTKKKLDDRLQREGKKGEREGRQKG